MSSVSPLRALVATALPLLAAACGGSSPSHESSGTPEPEAAAPQDAEQTVERLEKLLTGRFDSSEQAERDDGYFAVQLTTCPASVPALGRHVLYVEQALLSSLDSPYRQRLYVLTAQDGDEATSAVYQPFAPAGLVGLCAREAAERDAITPGPDDVEKLVGCEVHLAATGDGFVGGTVDRACATDFNGASYMNSEVAVTPTLLSTWDRGFDASGEQVWGALDGPYEFVRRE